MKPMRLEDILFSQGFGTRRVCAGLVQQGYVSVNGEAQEDPGVFFDGNYQEYEADKKKRLGEEGAKPKRVRFKALK